MQRLSWYNLHRGQIVSCLMCIYFIIIGVSGLIGFKDPSVTLEATIGWMVFVYSGGFAFMGSLGLLALVTRARRAEGVALLSICLLTGIHGLVLIQAPEGSGLQTGARLLAALFGVAVLAILRYDGTVSLAALEQVTKEDDSR